MLRQKLFVPFVALLCCPAFVIAQTGFSLKWKFPAQGAIGTSPALDSTGNVYFGSGHGGFYAVNPEGTPQWEFVTNGGIVASPAMARDGTVFFSSSDHNFYALNPNGTLKWKRYFSGQSYPKSAVIGDDHTVYVSADKLYAIHPDGNIKWTADVACNEFSAPVIGHDGTIYTAHNGISAVSKEGLIKWTFYFPGVIAPEAAGGRPAIGADGTIYVGSKDYHLYAINTDGTLYWRFKTGSWVISSPVILPDGALGFGSNDGNFYLLNSNGTPRNQIRLSDSVPYQFCLGADNSIYVCSERTLLRMSSSGIITGQFTIHYNNMSAPTIAPDGTLYVGTNGGESGSETESYLFAINTNSSGLARSPWPKYGRDHRNTGSAYDANSPVAKAGQNYIKTGLQGTVLLDGTPSQIPANAEVTYLWRCTKQPSNSTVTIVDSAQQLARTTLAQRGIYEFQLQVRSRNHPTSVTRVIVACAYQEFVTTGGAIGSPAIALDGTIYTGSNDNHMYAFTPDGTEKWRFAAGRDVNTPALGPDGTVYFGSSDQTFYAVRPDGTLKWQLVGPEGFHGAPAIAADQYIYTVNGGSLYAMSPSGSLQWRFQLSSDFIFAPIVGSDGTIYFNTDGGYLYALAPDRQVKWKYPYGSKSPLVLGKNGELYLSFQGSFCAVNPDGTTKWKYQDGQYFTDVHPVVDREGNIYVGTYSHIKAIDANGRLRWQYPLGSSNTSFPTSSAALGSDGIIYALAPSTNQLYALDQAGTLQWAFAGDGAALGGSPTIDDRGFVYLHRGGRLAALPIESTRLASGFWPKEGLNNRNSSSLYNSNSPNANIAQDTLYINFNSAAILDGTSSTDPDHDPLSYLWRCTAKPEQGRAVISDSTAAQTAVEFSLPGVYQFSLTVTDNEEGTNVDFVNVWYGLRWAKYIGGNGLTSLAIDSSQTAYISSPFNGFYALDPDGAEKWRYDKYASYMTMPVIGFDGSVYVAIEDSLFSFDPAGNLNWGSRVGTVENSSPALGHDSTVYVGTKYDQTLYAFTTQGVKKWDFRTDSWIFSSPVIALDGTIYAGSLDHKLYAIRPEGQLKWAFEAEGEIHASAAIGRDGIIYIGSLDKNLYALNPDGTKKWAYVSSGAISSAAVIGYGETIYFRSGDDRLHALTPEGSLKWTFAMSGYMQTASPLIGADSTIYVGSYDENFYALSPNGKVRWTLKVQGEVTQSAALTRNGMLLIPTQHGYVYSVQTSSLGLANTAWPKIQHDQGNSGHASSMRTAVAEAEESPESTFEVQLFPNFPNPFNARTVISFSLPAASRVKISIYGVNGIKVVTLLEGFKARGKYQVSWDGKDGNQQAVASGLYFYEIIVGKIKKTSKMLLMK